MNGRSFIPLLALLPFVWWACSSPAPVVEPDTHPVSDTMPEVAPDATKEGLACCPSGICHTGEACIGGACHAIPGSLGCHSASGCLKGQICESPKLCPCEDPSCEPESGTCLYPEGCCNADSECEETQSCLGGICHDAPAAGRCFTDLDCAGGLLCESAEPCTCGDEGCVPATGFCALPGPCCLGDEECGPVGQCLADGCEAKAEGGRCFVLDDCGAGEICAGASLCPCGTIGCLIPTTDGACLPEGEGCCILGSDCAGGEICVDGLQCVPAPESGSCYKDAHCGKGRVCQDANVCGCGSDGCVSVPGTCHTPLSACTGEGDCVPGMRCVPPDIAYCPGEGPAALSVCVPDVPTGCWASGDCETGERCIGEVICLDPAGCSEANIPGKCVSQGVKDVCCGSHLDCAPGFECRNSNTYKTCPPSSTSVCLPKPEYGISCWNYQDCPESQVCLKARICACGARCFKSGRGFCEPASQQVCNSDLDCGGSYSCARDLECVVNPCNATDDCPLGGQCHADMPGSCWNHKDCGDGSYCKGLRICPADAICDDIDKAGECAPKEEVGACCDSYFACTTGLRCMSSVAKTQCTLDVSSVCVPYGVFNQSCFSDAECAENRICMGQKMCACGLEGCDDPPTPGQCVLK